MKRQFMERKTSTITALNKTSFTVIKTDFTVVKTDFTMLCSEGVKSVLTTVK